MQSLVLFALLSVGFAAPTVDQRTSISSSFSDMLSCEDAVPKILSCIQPASISSGSLWTCLEKENCLLQQPEQLPQNLIVGYEKFLKDKRDEAARKELRKRADSTTTSTTSTTSTSTTSTSTSTTSTSTSTSSSTTTTGSTAASTASTAASTSTASSTSTSSSSSSTSSASTTTSTTTSTTSSSATASSTPLTEADVIGRWAAGTILVGFAASGLTALLVLYCRDRSLARKRRQLDDMAMYGDKAPLTKTSTLPPNPPGDSRYTDDAKRAAAADVALGQFDTERDYQDHYSDHNGSQHGNTAYSPLQTGNFNSRSPSSSSRAAASPISGNGSGVERSLTGSPARNITASPAPISPVNDRREPALPLLR